MKTFLKDPDAVLDYEWDWSLWLGVDTVSQVTIVATENLAIDSFSESGGKITVWISGGVIKTTGMVSCTIVTNQGRTDKRSALFYVDTL